MGGDLKSSQQKIKKIISTSKCAFVQCLWSTGLSCAAHVQPFIAYIKPPSQDKMRFKVIELLPS